MRHKPDGECLIAAEWTVRSVPLSVGVELTTRYHYARGGSNTATACHGLFRRDDPDICWGVAWWIPPTRNAAAYSWPENPDAVLSLSRLVLIPDAPKNAASFLIRRSIELLPERWECLVTYADEWQGHTGAIYKASGWESRGRTAKERCYLIDGKMTARKAGPKTYTHAEMLERGAECIGSFAKLRFRFVRQMRRAT